MPVSARRRFVAAAAVAVLLGSGCTAMPGWTPPQPPLLLVGVDLNLSGQPAQPGTVFHNGLLLQLEQLAEQPVAGRRLELRVLDNHGQAATSTANLAALAADPEVAAIITAGCPACVIEAAADLTVPVISLDPVEAVAAPAEARRWVFRIGPVAADNADALSRAMAQAGADTVGVIASDDPYGDEGLAWLREATGRDGLTVVAAQQVAVDAPDAARAAAAAVADWTPPADQPGFDSGPPVEAGQAGPDAVVLWLPAPQAGRAAEALREAGYGGGLYLDMLAADELFLPAAPYDGAGLVFTATPVADQRIAASPALAARQAWLRAYTARYDTYHLHSSFAADALLVLADAIGRTSGGDRADIRDRLESTRIDGLTGQIRFSAGQHSGLGSGALVLLAGSGNRWR